MKNLLFILIAVPLLCFSQKKEKNGLYETYHQNGEKKTSGNYKANKKTGLWQSYFNNGALKTKSIYNSKTSQLTLKEVYFKNGKTKSVSKINTNGTYLEKGYYKNSGHLLYQINYTEQTKAAQQLTGSYKDYYNNKKLKTEANYVNGNLDGLWQQFYDTGEINWKVNYKNGYKTGRYKKHHKNGTLELEGNCENNLKNGKETNFDNNGNIIWQGQYLNDKRQNNWVHINKDNKRKIYKYKNGVLKKDNHAISPVEIRIPVGDFETYPIYPGCEEMAGSMQQKKCLSNSISEFIKNNTNTYLIKKLNLKDNKTLNLLLKTDKNGKITPVKIKTPHPKLDKEALTIISKLPKITPGKRRGKPITTVTPITIKL